MNIIRVLLSIIIITTLYPVSGAHQALSGQGSRFVYSQLRFAGDWDPYPETFPQIRRYFDKTTSVEVYPERRILNVSDEKLYRSPFLVLTGRGSFPEFSGEDIDRLRRYIEGGGLLFIDTCSDRAFEESADRLIRRVFPRKSYKRIPDDHAVYRSFYLVYYVSGRTLNLPYLEGIETGGRLGVIKTSNDLLGIWPRDSLGNWRYSLSPGRHDQRKEAVKLTLNLLMYSVSGTYKSDPVHQPHIKEKLGR